MLLDHPAGLWSFKRLRRREEGVYGISGLLAVTQYLSTWRWNLRSDKRHVIWRVTLMSQYNVGLLTWYLTSFSYGGYDLVAKH